MRINPELQRYAWLEITPQRLVVMPVLLIIIMFLAGNNHNSPEEVINNVSEVIYLVLIGLWGGYKAAQSVLEEVNGNTWDWQRLSSLSPWALTEGKLFGSTCYCWYGALIALFFYAITAVIFMPADSVICNIVLLLFGGLICHITAIFLSLNSLPDYVNSHSRIRSNWAHVMGLVLGGLVVTAIRGVSHQGYTVHNHTLDITWYGASYDTTVFTTFFAPVFFLWLLAGAYWSMRSQLRMRTGPWLWTAFVLFMMFFVSGFAVNLYEKSVLESVLLSAFATGLVFLYVMAFTEHWNGVTYRKLKEHWQNRRTSVVIDVFPRWVVSLILTALVLIAAVSVPQPQLGNSSVPYVLTLFCFALRDIALLHYFKLYPQSSRAVPATIFYLGALYFLVPVFFKTINLPEFATLFSGFNLDYRANSTVISLLSSILQACLAISLAWSRWKKYWQ